MEFGEYLVLSGLASNTQYTYNNYNTHFQKYLKVYGFNNEAANQFLTRHNNQVSRAYLTKYLEYLKNQGCKESFEIIKIKGRRSKKMSQWFSYEEMKELMSRSPSPYNLLITLLFEGGLRITEALNITKEDVDGYTANKGIIISLKGNTRIVQLTNNTITELVHYCSKFKNSSTKIFSFDRFHAYYKIKRITKSVFPNKKRYYTHMFRISAATHLLKSGMDIRNIQNYLGHRSITATAKYAKTSSEDIKDQWKKIMEEKTENEKINW